MRSLVAESDNATCRIARLPCSGVSERLEPKRRPNVFVRVARFVRQVFSSGPSRDDPGAEPDEGGVGMREPRRPLRPTQSGAVALEIPPEEKRDVRAIGEDRD